MRKLALVLVAILTIGCTTETSLIEDGTTIENANKKPSSVNCVETIIPDNVDRQDVLDRLNSTGEIVNGNSETEVFIGYNKPTRQVSFGYLWNGGVQYAFTITDSSGNTVQDCITVTSNYTTFYDFRGRAGIYTVTFDGFPEVTRTFEFEITRGR